MKFDSLDQMKSALGTLWGKVFPAKDEKDGKDPSAEAPSGGATTDAPDLAAMTKRFEEIEAKVATNAQLTTELATAKQTIGTLTTEKTTLEGKVTALTNEKAQLTTKVSELEGKIADPAGTIAKESNKKAKDMVAGQGVPVDQLPEGQSGDDTGGKKAAAMKKYEQLLAEGKSLEAGKFYNENRELLWNS